MPYVHLSRNNIHGSSMCCKMDRKDLHVLVKNGVHGVAVQRDACPHVDSVSRFVEHMTVDQANAICRDPRLTKSTSAALCASSNH